jgi:cytochrome-b5 reductase
METNFDFKPLQRAYSSAPPPKSSGGAGNLALLLTATAIAGGGTYYIFVRDPSAARKAEQKAKDAARSASDAIGGVVGAKKALTGGDQDFVALQLEEVTPVNHNTKRFRFKLPEEDMVSGLHIASAVLTRFQKEGEKPVARPYTPISDEDQKGYVDLLVKKYDGGPMSSHVHDLVPGQKLEFKGPLPKYPWSANKHAHIGLLAGGTGITPMYQLLRAIFSNPSDKTKVTLVFGNIAEEDILLREQLAELENTYPQRFRAFYVLDKPPENWQGGKGYISKELLKTVLPEPKEENVKVFVCGPPGLMKALSGTKKSPRDQGELSGILKELGYTQEQVYKF